MRPLNLQTAALTLIPAAGSVASERFIVTLVLQAAILQGCEGASYEPRRRKRRLRRRWLLQKRRSQHHDEGSCGDRHLRDHRARFSRVRLHQRRQ